MVDNFEGLTALINDLTQTVQELTETQHKVVAAVRSDDLAALGECMKSEHALSLKLRNADQKRVQLQERLGVGQIKLTELEAAAPDEESGAALRQAVETLRSQYRILKSASEIARSSLECSLHEVEKMISGIGIDPEQVASNTAQISGTHTDFHA